MLKMWMEEYLPGYFIKYDGFRDSWQYTVILPTGRKCDVETLEKAHALLIESKGYYGSKVSCGIQFPLHGTGNRWRIDKYKGQDVCTMIEYTDGYCLVDLGSSEDFQWDLEIVHQNDLT